MCHLIPGTEACDPLNTLIIEDILDEVTELIVISKKSFRTGPLDVKQAIKNSLLIYNLVKHPEQHKVHLVTYPEAMSTFKFKHPLSDEQMQRIQMKAQKAQLDDVE